MVKKYVLVPESGLIVDFCRGEALESHLPEAQAFTGDEIRCGCGRLLIRQAPEGLELKCPRCKRTVIISIGQRE